jgi:hypothetical protein
MKSLFTARTFTVSANVGAESELRRSAEMEDADHARHAVSSRLDGTSNEGRKQGIAEARMPNIENRQYVQGAAKPTVRARCSKML